MKNLLILGLILSSLNAYESNTINHYNEKANTYIEIQYKQGLISDNHSEHMYLSLGVQQRIGGALFLVGRYGQATKTQDTYNQQCTTGSTNLCAPSETINNSLDATYIEYGASFHFIENKHGYGEFELTNRTTLSTGDYSTTSDSYFNGIEATLGFGLNIADNYGISLRSGIHMETGWDISAGVFFKF